MLLNVARMSILRYHRPQLQVIHLLHRDPLYKSKVNDSSKCASIIAHLIFVHTYTYTL